MMPIPCLLQRLKERKLVQWAKAPCLASHPCPHLTTTHHSSWWLTGLDVTVLRGK